MIIQKSTGTAPMGCKERNVDFKENQQGQGKVSRLTNYAETEICLSNKYWFLFNHPKRMNISEVDAERI